MANKARARKALVKATTKSAIPNQDPYFFIPVVGGNTVTAQEISDKPYQYHPWINAAARVICFNVARLTHVLVDKKNPDNILREHELLTLFERPNPFMSETAFWQAIILGLLLPSKSNVGRDSTGGQVFVVPVDIGGKPVDLTRGAIPAMLWPYTDAFFTPRRVEGKVVGWTFMVPNDPSTKAEYGLTEVIRINFFNPYDWLKGMSYYTPCQIAVLQDIKSDIFNTMFFDNDARPSGTLSSDQHLSDEQYRTYSKRWYENYGGAGNSGRIAMLGAGLKYSQMTEAHRDMQFVEQKQRIKDQIIASFGLNRIALGDYESINFATIREGRRMLWQDTYQPIDKLIWDAINGAMIRFLDGGKYEGQSDYSTVEALRPNWTAEATTAGLMVSQLKFTPALASRMAGLPLTEEHVKMYPWLDEKVEAAPSPFGAPADDEDVDEDDKPKKPPKKPPKDEDDDEDEEEKSLIYRYRGMGEDERVKLSWDYIHKILDPGEKRFLRQMERFFISQRNRMQDKVDHWLAEHSGEKVVKDIPIVGRVLNIDIEQFMLDLVKENTALTALWKPLVLEQMLAEQARLMEELGSLIEWNVTDEKVGLFIARRKEQIKSINTTTFERAREKVGDAIETAMNDNATPQATAKLVKEALGDVGEIRKNQAQTIARTETGTISSSSRFDAFHSEGIEFVEWLTAGDEKVRTEIGADHKAAGMAGPIRLGETFPGCGLRYPLDPRGSAANVINCVLPDTMIGGRIVAALKSRYSGDAIKITTKNGNTLTVTVNHPILADSGFIPAHALREGDNVICQSEDIDGCSAWGYSNAQNGISRAQDIYNSFAAHGATFAKAPCALDLDGDGQFLKENIDIVKYSSSFAENGICHGNMPLVDTAIPTGGEFVDNRGFVFPDFPEANSGPTRHRSGAHSVGAVMGTPSRFPSGGTLPDNSNGIIAHSVPLDCFRLGLCAELDVSRYEYSSYNASGYAEFLRDLVLGFPGLIELDSIAFIEHFRYDGHVYDLQSSVGYFNSNNILSRNCRCSLIAVEAPQ